MKNILKALLVLIGLISGSLLQAGEAAEELSSGIDYQGLSTSSTYDYIIKELTAMSEDEGRPFNPYELESFCSYKKRVVEAARAKGIDVNWMNIREGCPTSNQPTKLEGVGADELISFKEFKRRIFDKLEAEGIEY